MTQVLTNDQVGYRTLWTCERWSEDAVDFARRKLEREGISHIAGELREHVITPQLSVREALAQRILGRPVVTPQIVVKPRLMPITEGISSEMLRKYVGSPEDVVEIEGNLLLNEGIQRMVDLMIAAVSNQVAANAYGSTNAFIGVGDSSTAEAATQTDLQAATNHFYKGMNATFPSRSSQTVSFASDFTSAEANYAWAEWSVTAGATTASGSGFLIGTTNLNRKVSALGTKSTGTWTLTAQITFS